MKHLIRSLMVSALGLVAVAAMPACSSGETGEVRLGVNVAPLTATVDTTPDPRVASGLSITRVRVLVNVAKVGYAGQSADEASVGPYVVELTGDELTAGAQRSFSLGSLATGTYGGAEIEIDTLSPDADTSDPSLADFVATKASVIVDGTYQGAAFQYAGHFLAEQGTDGQVTIDAATPFDLGMTVNPANWFIDANGATIDPTDTAQHDAISAGICKSLDTQVQLTNDPTGTSGSGDAKGGHGGHGGGGGPAHCVEK